MRVVLLLSMMFGVSTPLLAAETARFSGAGALVAGAAESGDGRFALKAELARSDDAQCGGRFHLDARLAVGDLAKSTTAACTAAGDIFKNGFE